MDVGNWKTTSYTNSSKNWADKKGKVQDYSDFSVVAGFKEEYVLKQRDYHNGEIACTATSDAIAGSIANGKKLTPGKSYWKGNSCVWPNTEIIAGSKYFTVERQCQEIFKQIKEGIPVILRVPGHSVIAVGILAGLALLAGMKPFAGKSREERMDEAKTLPDVLSEEIERFRSEHQKGQSAAGNMAGNMTGNTAENAAGGSAAGRPAPNAQPGPRRMKENRGLLKYILIGAVTCGVYMLYTLHMLAKDTNEMCDGDGEATAGLLKLIVFTLITCTVYNYIWHYKLMNRIQNNAERYGVKVKTVGSMDLGACWVVLSLVGLLISWCGIGLILSLYADYLMFQNMNLLSKAYNAAVVDTYQA